ncbi:TRM11 family SAM-dependent methyltransferase [Metabacillus litoralis]|uniref:TRM11 family SAM-dependent methyltransferase n=1 Tax=Metabacillus litoralis TaxID=152268 RepID=UPI001CFDE6D7|nr:methyltransferase domain-containing protein [Metabacillus litoralis]
MSILNHPLYYIYTYAFHEDEKSLCQLEMRSLFGYDSQTTFLKSSRRMNPSRSPFIKERIEVLYKSESLDGLIQLVEGLEIGEETFKVICLENHSNKLGFKERRFIERKVGLQLKGKVDLLAPQKQFAIMEVDGEWMFGKYTKSDSVWLHHQNKPQNYSTALSTRLARAVVNIAVPSIDEVTVIDPCCGIGTVLIEALSMNINIVGSDRNPLVTTGARENIAFFGFEGEVILRDIRQIKDSYDVAIIDMPYNLCSVLPSEEKLDMLKSARRIAKKVVVITIEPIDSILQKAGFNISDRCVAKKGTFIREVIVCK